ncbi:13927_t:CDS:2 [Acaulospora morrowiae]|uniref:13927_t:CDS:1 n=1 Tax=Acaulospora morrowiae TaxID=94023 RepID=A0A9N9E1W3_9GLOM|nr:13927_t:CDS:2 [Acaulospora morrowiae]
MPKTARAKATNTVATRRSSRLASKKVEEPTAAAAPTRTSKAKKTNKTRRQKTDPEAEKSSEDKSNAEAPTQDAPAPTDTNVSTTIPSAQESTHATNIDNAIELTAQSQALY